MFDYHPDGLCPSSRPLSSVMGTDSPPQRVVALVSKGRLFCRALVAIGGCASEGARAPPTGPMYHRLHCHK